MASVTAVDASAGACASASSSWPDRLRFSIDKIIRAAVVPFLSAVARQYSAVRVKLEGCACKRERECGAPPFLSLQ